MMALIKTVSKTKCPLFYIYITYGVIFVQIHWQNQSRDIQNISCIFSSEETRPLVSIFTYIDTMLLNLEAPVPQQMKRKFVNLSVLKVLKNFIKFQIFQNISKF
jgi:hypothetical protein